MRAATARMKAEKAQAEFDKAREQQEKADQMSKAAEVAEKDAKKAEQAALDAKKQVEKAQSAGAASLVGEALLKKVVADTELKKIEEQNSAALLKQSAERTSDAKYMERYTAYVSTYQMSWQSFLEGVERTGSGLSSVNLILVDPPYEVNFVNTANRGGLGRLLDKMVCSGGTAVIFMAWQQINGWKTVFAHDTKSVEWVIEGIMPLHRHSKFAYRSALNGHKSMTEYVMIAHRKDRFSQDKFLKAGRKIPAIQECEEVLGDARSGSWNYDFMVDQCPPPRGW